MGSPGINYDLIAQQTGGRPAPVQRTGGLDYDALAAQTGGRPAPALTDNPNREGVYTMVSPKGGPAGIPYSQVQKARTQGYMFGTGDERARFDKDRSADPNQQKSLWQTINSPVNVGHLRDNIEDDELNANGGPQTLDAYKYAADHPHITALKTFLSSVGSDAGKMLLTPLGIGLAATGGVGEGADALLGATKGAGAAVTALRGATPVLKVARSGARMVTGAAGVGIAAPAAGDVATKPLPQKGEDGWDYAHRLTGDLAAVTGGAAAAGTLATDTGAAVQGAKDWGYSTLAGKTADRVIPGDVVTPRQEYQIAKDQGVNLDLAQANGNNGLPRITKNATEDSLGGSRYFEERKVANKEALQSHIEDVLNQTTPASISREDFGNGAKAGLIDHQKSLDNQAGAIFDELSQQAGTVNPDVTGIRAQAKQIINASQSYYKLHPEMLDGGTGRAWAVIRNLSQEPLLAPKTRTASPILDLDGNPMASSTPAPVAEQPKYTWSDLHKLRSDLMNQTRTPEIVGSPAEGWLKQITAAVDEAMTGAGSGLSGEQLQQFRKANALYSEMKSTYDNPQNPLYSVVRAPDGLTAANTLANIKPEIARYIQQSVPELMPHLQRQTMERLLSPAGNDVADMKTLPARWSRAQKEQIGGILTPAQIEQMTNIARTSKYVDWVNNASGTGGKNQARGEFTAMVSAPFAGAATIAAGHPVAGLGMAVAPYLEAAAARFAARKMNSPAFVDRVMSAPSKGPQAWLAKGAQNLRAAGVAEESIMALADSPAGQQKLMQAGSVEHGSRAMRALVSSISAQAEESGASKP